MRIAIAMEAWFPFALAELSEQFSKVGRRQDILHPLRPRNKQCVTLGACQKLGRKMTQDSGSETDPKIIDFLILRMV